MRYGESLNNALHKILEANNNAYLIGEDLLDPYGGAFKISKGLSTKYPSRVLSTPISEAAIMGFASGLAMRGMKPIIEIMFGDFITLIADQLINGAAKFEFMYNEQVGVPLVIRAPMGGYRGYGPTHSQSLESLFISIPNINIVYPSIYHDPGVALIHAFEQDSITLFFEGKTLYPKRVQPYASISPIAGDRPDVSIVCYGQIAEICRKTVIQAFREREITCDCISIESLKPLDFEITSPKVIIVEEGPGGAVGDHIAKYIYDRYFPSLSDPIRVIGAKDSPIPNSFSQELETLPSINDILEEVYELSS